MGVLLILLSGDAFAVRVYATQDGLDTEISNRTAADTAEVTNRNKAIARETARATKAEGALKAADTAEVNARDKAIVSAIASEVTNRDTAIATETARAKAAEAAGSFSYSMTCGVSGTDACKVGAVGPGGGWIFFVDYNNQYSFNYLEAAPADIPTVAWCVGAGDATTIYSPTPSVSEYWALKGVGQGAANTVAMKSMCTSGAAYSVSAYTNNGKSDWFLPSLGELKLMYTNLLDAGVGGFANYNYWSSTETNSSNAWTQAFGSGYQGTFDKYFTTPVRAVRAF